MKKGIININKKYTKIMLLALLVIASILSMYLVTNTNNKVFNAKIINQKADTREIVNIPDQDLKNFLLKYLKKPLEERRDKYSGEYIKLVDNNYIKPSSENEIYKDEMEKITYLNISFINSKEESMQLIGLEKSVNLTYLSSSYNKIENIESLRGLKKFKLFKFEF